MFDIAASLATGAQLISSYGSNGFTVSGTLYDGSIILHEGTVTLIEPALSGEGVTPSVIESFLTQAANKPEVLLLGMGRQHVFMPPSVRQSIRDRYNVGVDTMDTGAACRTYNVLVSEGRRVAAILRIL